MIRIFQEATKGRMKYEIERIFRSRILFLILIYEVGVIECHPVRRRRSGSLSMPLGYVCFYNTLLCDKNELHFSITVTDSIDCRKVITAY